MCYLNLLGGDKSFSVLEPGDGSIVEPGDESHDCKVIIQICEVFGRLKDTLVLLLLLLSSSLHTSRFEF